MQTPCGFRTFAEYKPKKGKIDSLNCTSRTRHYSTSRPEKQNYLSLFLCLSGRSERGLYSIEKTGRIPICENSEESEAPATCPIIQGHFTDASIPSRKASFGSRVAGYFRGRTESFIALPTRNLSVVFAGI